MPFDTTPEQILERAVEAGRIAAACGLCPRRCGVDRASGEQGYCGAGPLPSVAAFLPHFGEEPPLVGQGGAGTIFFSGCNLRCVYCQNHQISQRPAGRLTTPEELGRIMIELRDRGCATLEPVSPSHHLPGLLEALAAAVQQGVDLPVVYNTNAYEAPETLDLLEGVVDVYLPDLKYASNERAREYSGAGDYVDTARAAILKMYSQVGNLVVDINGQAVRGMILRHLVLPGELAGTHDTLSWVADNLPGTVTISLMAQYAPLHRAGEFPQLDRGLTAEEYDEAVDLAWELGLENVFVQDLDSRNVGIPDFVRNQPFEWEA
jgi:putative pyruvate formate lyase activating enzyme